MRYDIAHFFGLEGWLVDEVRSEKKRLIFEVRSASTSACCGGCGRRSSRIHERRTREVLHGAFEGRAVVLSIHVRRFWCKRCVGSFTEALSGIAPWARRSDALKDQILSELASKSFRDAGAACLSGAETVRRVLLAAPLPEAVRWPARGELRMGIDGKGRSHGACPLTVMELRRRRLMAVLPDDRKETTKGFFLGLSKDIASRIEEICMDMDRGLWAAVKETLPKTKIVTDHFHVIKQANGVIDEVRRAIQHGYHPIPKKPWLKGKEKLKRKEYETIVEYGARFPILMTLWILKEDLRRMYDQHNKCMAAHRLRKIIDGYRNAPSGYARAFADTLTRWHEEILNFFDHRTTNAAVEGAHQKMELIERKSFGFKNIQTFISKILLAFIPLFFLFHHPHL